MQSFGLSRHQDKQFSKKHIYKYTKIEQGKLTQTALECCL